MCHSPSGAFRVQAPERAWALAVATRANDRPAAIPPDSTFCVKRFITDLRMKGGSTALLQSGAKCCSCRNGEADIGLGCRSAAGAILRKSELSAGRCCMLGGSVWRSHPYGTVTPLGQGALGQRSVFAVNVERKTCGLDTAA